MIKDNIKTRIKEQLKIALAELSMLNSPVLSENVKKCDPIPKEVVDYIHKDLTKDFSTALRVLSKDGCLVSTEPKSDIYAFLWNNIRFRCGITRSRSSLLPFRFSRGIKKKTGFYVPFYLLSFSDKEKCIEKLNKFCDKIAKELKLNVDYWKEDYATHGVPMAATDETEYDPTPNVDL